MCVRRGKPKTGKWIPEGIKKDSKAGQTVNSG